MGVCGLVRELLTTKYAWTQEVDGREVEDVDGKVGGVHGIKGIKCQAKDFEPLGGLWRAMEEV